MRAPFALGFLRRYVSVLELDSKVAAVGKVFNGWSEVLVNNFVC